MIVLNYLRFNDFCNKWEGLVENFMSFKWVIFLYMFVVLKTETMSYLAGILKRNTAFCSSVSLSER